MSVTTLEAKNYSAPSNSDPPTKLFNGIHRCRSAAPRNWLDVWMNGRIGNYDERPV